MQIFPAALPTLFFLAFIQLSASAQPAEPAAPQPLAPWREGYLDIHHISVDGNATLLVMPDGTTLLFDAGTVDQAAFEARVSPLKAAPRRPDRSLRSGQWQSRYIREVVGQRQHLDYLVLSHFHEDHYGKIDQSSPWSTRGRYRLSGVTDIAEEFDIGLLIDRDYPGYDFAAAAARRNDQETFDNYVAFVRQRSGQGQRTEALRVGARDQIVLRRAKAAYPEFEIRGVKRNNLVWDGKDGEVHAFDESVIESDSYNENPLSAAIVVRYGQFDYFTGGDTTGPPEYGFPAWFDTETPIAGVVGEVDAMSLNHHGVRDANNATFLAALQPQVAVMQSYSSDHPGQEVLYRLRPHTLYPGPRDFFATFVHSETLTTIGPWFAQALRSRNGHIVIRVAPGGGTFEVFVLDDSRPGLHVKASFGPYQARDRAAP